jgi:hypothetical protein
MRNFLNSLWTDRARVLQGAAAGAALIVALGFNWFGGYGFNWTLGATAQKMASVAATDAMIPSAPISSLLSAPRPKQSTRPPR